MESYRREGSKNFFIQSCSSKVNGKKEIEKGSGGGGEEGKGEGRNECGDEGRGGGKLEAEEGREGSGGDRLSGEAYYLFKHPNLCINRYGDWMDTNIVWPINATQCVVEFEWYVEKKLIEKGKYFESIVIEDMCEILSENDSGNMTVKNVLENLKNVNEKNWVIEEGIRESEVVQEEDINLCERVQRGLRSSAYRGREGRYAPTMEIGECNSVCVW